ncbi:hypothetical protein TIFTF001_046541 [Ficus carica]|uniref:Uncharacterized protein n=1 Tax=Ficus carica TaxID=3494 RepID=A0AA87ZRJ3_FICCA|nr:hypothetical protein TIFTF001_046541 [Ficus carica]
MEATWDSDGCLRESYEFELCEPRGGGRRWWGWRFNAVPLRITLDLVGSPPDLVGLSTFSASWAWALAASTEEAGALTAMPSPARRRRRRPSHWISSSSDCTMTTLCPGSPDRGHLLPGLRR